jgi:hypothetical protein
MKSNIKKSSSQKDIGKANHSAAGNFQRTKKDTDDASRSEKEFLNKKTREGNIKPDKNKIN